MNRMELFKRGLQENGDVYTAILINLGAAIASVTGRITITIALSLMLVTLGLLAFSIRRDRQADHALTKSFAETTQTLQEISTSTKNLAVNQLSIQPSLLELSSAVKSLTLNKAFGQQSRAYRSLVEIIEKEGAKEVVFLQYSCRSSFDVLYTALHKGANATIFVQHEDTAAKLGSQLQANRIIESIKGLRSDLGRKTPQAARLTVYKYSTPASVSAIKIDDRVICMGWYIYEKVDAASYNHYRDDQIEVSGHDVAALLAWKGTAEFDALNKTFNSLKEHYLSNAEEVQL